MELRIWIKGDIKDVTATATTTTYKRYNGGRTITEVIGDQVQSYNVIKTVQLENGELFEVLQPEPCQEALPSYLQFEPREQLFSVLCEGAVAHFRVGESVVFSSQNEEQFQQSLESCRLSSKSIEKILSIMKTLKECTSSSVEVSPTSRQNQDSREKRPSDRHQGRGSGHQAQRQYYPKAPDLPEEGGQESQLPPRVKPSLDPTLQERSVPARKSPAHISGRLMEPCVILDS